MGSRCQCRFEIMDECSLNHMISEMTHYAEDKESIIDLYLRAYLSFLDTNIYMSGLVISEHDSILVEINTYPHESRNSPSQVRLLKKMDLK